MQKSMLTCVQTTLLHRHMLRQGNIFAYTQHTLARYHIEYATHHETYPNQHQSTDTLRLAKIACDALQRVTGLFARSPAYHFCLVAAIAEHDYPRVAKENRLLDLDTDTAIATFVCEIRTCECAVARTYAYRLNE